MKKMILVLSAFAILMGAAFYIVNNTASKSVPSGNQTGSAGNSGNTSEGSDKTINKILLKMKAKDFKLKDLDGNEISLSNIKGKNVYINFWATWCSPCKSEMSELQKLYQETKGTDLVILTVNLGEDRNTVNTFMKSNNYGFEVLLDSGEKVSTLYNISSIPTSLFVDKDGYLVAKHVGAMNIDEMKSYISLLNKN